MLGLGSGTGLVLLANNLHWWNQWPVWAWCRLLVGLARSVWARSVWLGQFGLGQFGTGGRFGLGADRSGSGVDMGLVEYFRGRLLIVRFGLGRLSLFVDWLIVCN